MSSGAVAYLTKPINIHKLLDLVDEAVEAASGQGRPAETVAGPDATG